MAVSALYIAYELSMELTYSTHYNSKMKDIKSNIRNTKNSIEYNNSTIY